MDIVGLARELRQGLHELSLPRVCVFAIFILLLSLILGRGFYWLMFSAALSFG